MSHAFETRQRYKRSIERRALARHIAIEALCYISLSLVALISFTALIAFAAIALSML